MESRSNPDFSGDRLTLSDIGVNKDDLQAELEALKPTPDNVIQMSDYRPAEDQANKEKTIAKTERKKKLKVIALSGAALLTTAKFTYENLREKIHPAERIVNMHELDTATDISIEDITPGDEITVSPFSYTITGGNVRTSPQVMPGDENLVQNTDLSGKVITHPIESPDKSNSQNGNWFIFYDSDGEKFAINQQNLTVVPDSSVSSSAEIEVIIDKTTNMGIIAHDSNNVSMQVATVVDVEK